MTIHAAGSFVAPHLPERGRGPPRSRQNGTAHANFTPERASMTMNYAISPAGLALIQDCEGFRPDPAPLPDGAFVVGYGHVRVGEAGPSVTEEQAAGLLAIDLAPVEALVNAHVTARITQSQFDALASFALSVGKDAFVQSQVLRRVNNAEHIAAACAMDAWRKAEVNGELEVVDALVRRRAAEKALYLKDCAVQSAPSVFLRAYLDHAAAVLGAPVAFAPAPRVEHAPPQRMKPEAPVRLAEILKSEPATDALLLTQVVPDDGAVDEIITAHAKPAARKVEDDLAFVPRDRRISRQRAGEVGDTLWERLIARLDLSQSFETVGLIALVVFGVGVLLVAGSLVMGEVEDMAQVTMALGLAVPGFLAVGAGGVTLWQDAPKSA
jgi:GH24 family phage-related lysozyme (muramidase)